MKHYEPEVPNSESDYTDIYFTNTLNVLKSYAPNTKVTLQIFAKKEGTIAGIDEVVNILKTIPDIHVEHVVEGSHILPHASVMHITGKYINFVEYETVILGILARRSLVATNAAKVVKAARRKEVIFMGARHEDPMLQTVDGYAASVGGIKLFSTHANTFGIPNGATAVGTMPHALIAAMKGDTVRATLELAYYFKRIGFKGKLISLVDFNNNCPKTAVDVFNACKREGIILDGVRLDTSERLIDFSLSNYNKITEYQHQDQLRGVNPLLVLETRRALDYVGGESVGIYVSGGFHANKIDAFGRVDLPITGYGVGSSILGHVNPESSGMYSSFDFTADVVSVDGELVSKFGRRYNPIKTRVKEFTTTPTDK